VDKPVELNVRTTTLDGEPQAAEGTVRIYPLKAPATVQRPYMGEVSQYRPGPKTPDLSDPNNWELGDVVSEQGFATDAKGTAKLVFKPGAGAFRAMLETQDRFGKKVTGRLPLRVLEPGATKLAIKVPFLLAAPALAYN